MNIQTIETIQIPVREAKDIFAIIDDIDEGEAVSQVIGIIDHPDDSDTSGEALKAVTRLYADIRFLKEQIRATFKAAMQ